MCRRDMDRNPERNYTTNKTAYKKSEGFRNPEMK